VCCSVADVCVVLSAVEPDITTPVFAYLPAAGLLPPHPLMHPRRLTTGDLGNTTNAWGSAPSEATPGALYRRSAALSAGAVPPIPGATEPGLLACEGSDAERSDWGYTQSNSPTSFSPVNGWPSRPTTGAGTTSRIGTAAVSTGSDRGFSAQSGSGAVQQPGMGWSAAPGSGVSLPRIRTPDNAGLDAGRSNSGHGARSPGVPSPGQAAAGALLPGSAALTSAVKRTPSIKKAISMARVAFREPDGLPRDK
jgi:hypothetical protein